MGIELDEQYDHWVIPFTQYLRPDGRKQPIEVEVFEETAAKAKVILDYGWAFEVEVLTTGQISMTVSDGEEDRAIELCANDPHINDTLKKLVDSAYEAAKEND